MNKYTSNSILITHSNLQTAQKLARFIRKSQYFSEIISHSDLVNNIKEVTPTMILTDNLDQTKHVINNLSKNIAVFDISLFNLDLLSDQKSLEKIIKSTSCQPIWTTESIIKHHLEAICSQVKNEEVILGLSGGVDSSVMAALLHKAIGSQLTCVFVDTGLMRLNEGDNIMKTFADHMGIKILRIDAENRFLMALEGVFDPETKRKIIGKLFIEIFEEESQKLSKARWLAQGTIYPDILESLHTKDGVAVKSHHNVGGLPEKMNLKLIEPLSNLFKDEVRELGIALGLPKEMVYRHPFPGPGLGVRIIGEVKKEYADILRLADNIFITELRKAGLYDKTSQAFAVFIPIKSVGVVNDMRVYDYVISLRAIETIDFMSARVAHLPYDFLELVSNKIIKNVSGVSRVTYDISNKPPATIEWE